MENIRISLNTVLPMFLMIGVGCLAKQRCMISAEAVREANGLCFNLFMSVLLFQNIYTSDPSASFHAPLLALCLGGILAEFLLGLLLIPRIEPSNPARGVMLQSFFRTNTILLGLPIATSLFGADQIGQVSVIVAFVVPSINILAVVALELYRGGKPNVRKILQGVATNPLVLGAAAGITVVLTGIRLPSVVESTVSSIAKASTPLALVLMGASLDFSRFRTSLRNLMICVLERLVVMPALFIAIAVSMGFRDVALCTVMVVFGAPVAVSTYTMALQMDGDADLAGGVVLLTTGFSCLTLFLWIWLLKALGLL